MPALRMVFSAKMVGIIVEANIDNPIKFMGIGKYL